MGRFWGNVREKFVRIMLENIFLNVYNLLINVKGAASCPPPQKKTFLEDMSAKVFK